MKKEETQRAGNQLFLARPRPPAARLNSICMISYLYDSQGFRDAAVSYVPPCDNIITTGFSSAVRLYK